MREQARLLESIMKKEPLIRLNWHGHETLTEIPELLDRAERIEITLPADYNHALFRTLNPHAPTSALEKLDAGDGPGLLADIATVQGLEGLAELTEVLTAVHASVRIVSPPTLVIELSSSTNQTPT